MNTKFYRNEWIVEHKGALYMPMIETADIVAKRYGISREKQDEYALMSQQRTAAGQKAGRFDAEIVPMTTVMAGREQGDQGDLQAHRHARARRGQPPRHHLEGLAKLKPVRGDDQFITAGNASQLSDGASACVLMSDKEAARRKLKPLGIFRGFAGGRLRARRDGHRPGLRHPAPAAAHGRQDGRHRPVGAQRGVRHAGASTAATSSASPRRSSTSTAAPSPSATPTA